MKPWRRMIMLLPLMTTKAKTCILGLDPGLGRTGYAILGGTIGSPQLITFGCIETSSKLTHRERLVKLTEEIKKLLTRHQPTGVALERLYFSTNVKTALQVAEARGAITLTISHFGCPLYEFSPQEVKIAATGEGRADKKQVQKMLKLMFKLKEPPKPDDAADAVAVALCGLARLSIII